MSDPSTFDCCATVDPLFILPLLGERVTVSALGDAAAIGRAMAERLRQARSPQAA